MPDSKCVEEFLYKLPKTTQWLTRCLSKEGVHAAIVQHWGKEVISQNVIFQSHFVQDIDKTNQEKNYGNVVVVSFSYLL